MQKITLTVTEAAELIGVSQTTIYTMAREGQIPHARVRGRILFHREVIESWLRGGFQETQQA
ncbi:helix-turn-helix domain-containing protein [Paenibacillus lemnae]|uniref:Helix-turn-helix domain-containing protein n=1 Tax=Paenibacillus lemnae TaxID=1330551 RepID=A0A848MBM0_PAELE|nr:helix-turn-helix domain-containing protein [Paenibacillus lemnae]NMO97452.1 helix-turn-helix domain-containing protein [Paenibacillus lemnae]